MGRFLSRSNLVVGVRAANPHPCVFTPGRTRSSSISSDHSESTDPVSPPPQPGHERTPPHPHHDLRLFETGLAGRTSFDRAPARGPRSAGGRAISLETPSRGRPISSGPRHASASSPRPCSGELSPIRPRVRPISPPGQSPTTRWRPPWRAPTARRSIPPTSPPCEPGSRPARPRSRVPRSMRSSNSAAASAPTSPTRVATRRGLHPGSDPRPALRLLP